MLYYSYQNNVTAQGGDFDFKYEGFVSSDNNTEPEELDEYGNPVIKNEEPQLTPNNEDKGLFEIDFFANENQPEEETNNSASHMAPSYYLDGPTITLENTTLYLNSRFDTLVIENTSGSLQINNKMFVGKGGKSTWANVSSDMQETYVKFQEYAFRTSDNSMIVESVVFYNEKLSEEITGVFEYKMPTSPNRKSPAYPKFTSHSNNVTLKNLSRGLTYTGAFSLIGKKFSSNSVDNKTSTIIYNNGKQHFLAESNHFIFQDSTITSPSASVMIFIANDTILHPGVNFSFDPVGLNVHLKKEKGKFKHTYFRNTYHGFEMGVDEVHWNMPSDSLTMTIGAAKRLTT
jgi:hypothetical protein